MRTQFERNIQSGPELHLPNVISNRKMSEAYIRGPDLLKCVYMQEKIFRISQLNICCGYLKEPSQ